MFERTEIGAAVFTTASRGPQRASVFHLLVLLKYHILTEERTCCRLKIRPCKLTKMQKLILKNAAHHRVALQRLLHIHWVLQADLQFQTFTLVFF